MLLVVCYIYIRPESSRSRITCVLLVLDTEGIWVPSLQNRIGWDPDSQSLSPNTSTRTAPITRYFPEGCTWHHLYILVKAPLCCDWKDWAASAQNFTLWQQATTAITRRAHSISVCSCHIYMGVSTLGNIPNLYIGSFIPENLYAIQRTSAVVANYNQ